MQKWFWLSLPLFFLLGCQQQTADVENSVSVETQPDYAKNFTIEEKENYKILQLKNAWKGNDKTYTYVLYDKKQNPPNGFLKEQLIPVPVEKVVCQSTTHVAFIDALGAAAKIKGISGAKYIYNKKINDKINKGQIIEVGNDRGLNYENLLSLQPDVVFSFGIDGSNQLAKMKELGMKPILIAEWMEQTPLGRAEWLKFFGAFFGLENEALEKFDTIKKEYENLKLKLEGLQGSTTFTGMGFEGNWHVPEGQSYLANTIREAGGTYLWEGLEGTGSRMIDFETFYTKAKDAKIWLNVNLSEKLEDLPKTDNRYRDFQSWKNGEVYNPILRRSEAGGIDIYESGVIQPHIILKDLAKIFHPELMKNHKFYYYKKLN